MSISDKKRKKTRLFTFLIILIIIGGGVLQILFSFPFARVFYVIEQGGTYIDSERVMVQYVAPDSPAANADIKIGDYITSIDNKVVTNPETIINAAREKVGDEIEIKIERDNQKIITSVIPRENPPTGEGSIGISIANKELRKESLVNLVPKTVLQSYFGNRPYSFDALNVWYKQPHRFIRLQGLLFGLVWIVVGVGLLQLKRWAWYGYFLLFALNWLLFFVVAFLFVNITSLDTIYLIEIVVEGILSILLSVYIYRQKEKFIVVVQENHDQRASN